MTRSVLDMAGKTQQRLVDGEFLFTIGDFRAIAAMLHGDAGVWRPAGRRILKWWGPAPSGAAYTPPIS